MRIDLKRLREQGFDVDVDKDNVNIYSNNIDREVMEQIDRLCQNHGIDRMYTIDIQERLHEYQIISAIMK